MGWGLGGGVRAGADGGMHRGCGPAGEKGHDYGARRAGSLGNVGPIGMEGSYRQGMRDIRGEAASPSYRASRPHPDPQTQRPSPRARWDAAPAAREAPIGGPAPSRPKALPNPEAPEHHWHSDMALQIKMDGPKAQHMRAGRGQYLQGLAMQGATSQPQPKSRHSAPGFSSSSSQPKSSLPPTPRTPARAPHPCAPCCPHPAHPTAPAKLAPPYRHPAPPPATALSNTHPNALPLPLPAISLSSSGPNRANSS